jgi:bifunctional DNase/RNase
MAVAHLGVDRNSNTPVVVLREEGGERTLPIFIGAPEATAIALELKGEKPPRPMTHDLLKALLIGLGGQLRRVNISGLRENTYLARLLVYRGEAVFELDARPSDSIALALRTNAPIFANEDLLDREVTEAGEPDDEARHQAEALKKFLAKLNPEDLGRFQP